MKSADYERIKALIGDIFEENSDFIKDIPLDILGLAQRMGFKIIKASDRIKLSLKKAKAFKELNRTKSIYGYSFFDSKSSSYCIYYDDVNAGTVKQRFSIAHEIGHIILGHIDNNVELSDIAEKEADYFAGYILCPDCIATNEEIFNYLNKNITYLPWLFDISIDTAFIKEKYLHNRHSLPNKSCYEYERIIMKCLEEAVLKKIRD